MLACIMCVGCRRGPARAAAGAARRGAGAAGPRATLRARAGWRGVGLGEWTSSLKNGVLPLNTKTTHLSTHHHPPTHARWSMEGSFCPNSASPLARDPCASACASCSSTSSSARARGRLCAGWSGPRARAQGRARLALQILLRATSPCPWPPAAASFFFFMAKKTPRPTRPAQTASAATVSGARDARRTLRRVACLRQCAAGERLDCKGVTHLRRR